MLIGELLRERGWVEPGSLDRAIAEQRHTGKRLCSLLVARGALEPDAAARALGAQHNAAAALSRHLDNRDKKLARLVPAELARSLCALPIGRGRSGELIIVVRDPRPAVQTALAQATRQPILLAVAAASVLERLVDNTYGSADTDEFDVDLSTGPIDLPPDANVPASSALRRDAGRALDPMSLGDIDISALSLVGLDDERVSKDHSQSGSFALPRAITPAAPGPVPSAPPPAQLAPFAEGTSRPGPAIKLPSGAAQPISAMGSGAHAPARVSGSSASASHGSSGAPGSASQGSSGAPGAASPGSSGAGSAPSVSSAASSAARPAEPPAPTLDETMVRLERAQSRDAATDVAWAFIRGRWVAALLLTIKEGAAFGHRGHGGQLGGDAVQAVTVPLATPSIIRAAHDARALVTDPPPKNAIQDRVNRLLGNPTAPAAVPVTVGQRIACVIVVGDPRSSPAAAADAAIDLDDLAVALGNAYARIVRDAKK